MSKIKAYANFGHAWLAALSHELTGNSMHPTPSENEFKNSKKHANLLIMITESRIIDWIAEEVHCMYAKCIQLKVQTQIYETVVNILKFGHTAA